MNDEISLIGKIYSKFYNKICGVPPNLFFWHFQWLAVKELYPDLKQILPTLQGKLLDVGCGDKPYEVFLNLEKIEHIGLDIYLGDRVDIPIIVDEPWPLETSSFDAVLCTQVLEHTANLENLILEITRVLKVGGIAIISVPFIYNQHGVPDDYRRFSIYGIKNLMEKGYEIITVKTQGGVGSTLGVLILNWLEMQMNLYKITRLLKGMLLPAWIILCIFINTLGWILDYVDKTESFYSNTWLVARKRCA